MSLPRAPVRLSRLLAWAVAVSLFTAAAAPARVLMGIGDNNPSVFTNRWFTGLGVKRTRLITPYDVALRNPGSLTSWMLGAAGDHQDVVVAFNPSSGSACPGSPCKAPSPAAYAKAFAAFHALYPIVKTIQPWNEVNSLTQPTSGHPEAVVAYYQAVRRICPACTVLGADLEDLKKGPGVPARIDLGSYIKSLLAAYRRARVPVPKVWGLHNYVDVNYFKATGTKTALRLLPGQLWLTETGGLFRFVLSSGKVRLKADENRQGAATKWLVKLGTSNARIARIYVYDMLYTGGQRFDSSLLGPGQVPRKAYFVLSAHYRSYFG